MSNPYTFSINPGSEAILLPLPAQDNGLEMEYMPFGSARRMHSAAYRVQHIANKWRVRVTWTGLTTAERSTVWGVYGGYIATSMVVQFPNGLSFTGFVELGSWSERQWYDPHQSRVLYDVQFVIVEA